MFRVWLFSIFYKCTVIPRVSEIYLKRKRHGDLHVLLNKSFFDTCFKQSNFDIKRN